MPGHRFTEGGSFSENPRNFAVRRRVHSINSANCRPKSRNTLLTWKQSRLERRLLIRIAVLRVELLVDPFCASVIEGLPQFNFVTRLHRFDIQRDRRLPAAALLCPFATPLVDQKMFEHARRKEEKSGIAPFPAKLWRGHFV